MIKLKRVNKYFNRGKGNEIHVLKDINLTLPTKGLVVILGASGSGKTTLLNIIGGLDKPSSGEVQFNDNIFNKYYAKKWDKIRNQDIGYIFQNYNLLHELTVFDNIEMVLKMKGLKDPVEIQKRVDYITEKLGMLNYQDRKSNALSGGQQQRVAIARALVKNPELIIADEPTGNLDSKTTIEIINIIKTISEEKLVILVTHETEIAEFYADRIIKLSDGKIVNDIDNKVKGNLEIRQEHIIYLKDLKKEEASIGNIDFKSFSDKSSEDDNIDVELIQRNETVYLKIDSDKRKRVKYLDEHSEIKLLDEHYLPENSEIDDAGFDLKKLSNGESDEKSKSVISISDSVRYSLRKIDNLTYGGKMLYVVLGLIGALIAVSIGLIGQIFSIDDEEFIVTNRNYVNVIGDDLLYDDVEMFEDLDYIESVNLVKEQIEFVIETEPYYEIKNPIKIDAHPSDISLISDDDIIYGVFPQNEFEVVIDRMLANQIIRLHKERGVESFKDIINSSIKLQATGLESDYDEGTSLNFQIVGISNDGSPTVWLSEELIFSIALNSIADFSIFGEGFEIITGFMPTEPYQLLLHEESNLIRNGNVPSFIGVESGQYEVVGTYKYIVDGDYISTKGLLVSTLDIMKRAYFYQNDFEYTGSEFLVYASNVDLAIDLLLEDGIYASSNYEDDLEDFKEFEYVNSIGLLIFAVVGIISSGISVLFIMRSSLTSRMYEVSVYRGLGAAKRDIRKMFVVEITIVSTISSLIGYLIMAALLMKSQDLVNEYVEILYYSPLTLLLGIVSLYIVNIFFGLLPVNTLLFKTPAKILTQYDI